MCLIFFGLNAHPTYKLILAANRDEFYGRKTAPASWWPDQPDVLGGRDLEAGGTWLALSKSGRISMVTNFRDPKNIRANAPSRGALVADFVSSHTPPGTYMEELNTRARSYNGFNLITGNTESLYYLSNYREGISKLDRGIFGLSNHLLDTPWPKVIRGKEEFSKLISKPTLTSESLFDLLSDEKTAPDNSLPDTGVGLERERALSAMFIKSPGYGTRCSTVILADRSGHIIFTERVYDLETFRYTTRQFDFIIEGGK